MTCLCCLTEIGESDLEHWYEQEKRILGQESKISLHEAHCAVD